MSKVRSVRVVIKLTPYIIQYKCSRSKGKYYLELILYSESVSSVVIT